MIALPGQRLQEPIIGQCGKDQENECGERWEKMGFTVSEVIASGQGIECPRAPAPVGANRSKKEEAAVNT